MICRRGKAAALREQRYLTQKSSKGRNPGPAPLSFSFNASLAFSRRRYDSPLHVFNFSPSESSFLIPLVRILENPRCRTRMRSFLGQPLRPQDPSRTRKGSRAKETHQTAPPHVRKKDSGRHKEGDVGDGRRIVSREKSLSRLAGSDENFRIIVIVHGRFGGESRRRGSSQGTSS